MTPEKHVKGPLRQISYLAIQNEALRGVGLVDAVFPVREGVPRFIYLRLESAAPLFPGIAALAFDPLPENWSTVQGIRAHVYERTCLRLLILRMHSLDIMLPMNETPLELGTTWTIGDSLKPTLYMDVILRPVYSNFS